MTTVIYDRDIIEDRLKDQPYARFNRTSELSLSTSWQRINYNGSSTLNANTYPNSPVVENVKQVDWDTTNNLFTFNRDTLGLYDLTLTFEFEGGIRPSAVDMRFVIPSPTPIYFPLPDTLGYMELVDIARRDATTKLHTQTIRTSQVVIDNGIGVELRCDVTGLLAKPKLKHAIMEIYPQ